MMNDQALHTHRRIYVMGHPHFYVNDEMSWIELAWEARLVSLSIDFPKGQQAEADGSANYGAGTDRVTLVPRPGFDQISAVPSTAASWPTKA
jgi:hypothetical protein